MYTRKQSPRRISINGYILAYKPDLHAIRSYSAYVLAKPLRSGNLKRPKTINQTPIRTFIVANIPSYLKVTIINHVIAAISQNTAIKGTYALIQNLGLLPSVKTVCDACCSFHIVSS